MDVRHLKALTRRLHANQHSAVHRPRPDSTVSAADLAPHDHDVSLGNDLQNLHSPIRKRREDILERAPNAFATHWPAKVLCILGEVGGRRFGISTINAFQILADDRLILGLNVDGLSEGERR